jgi:hypothetical protein
MNLDNQKHQGVLDKPHVSDEKDVIGRNINEPRHKTNTFRSSIKPSIRK